MTRETVHTWIFNGATFALAAVIPFSNRLTALCIILLALNWLAEGRLKMKLKIACKDPFTIVCLLFYLLELTGLLYTHDLRRGFYHAQTEASFLVLPLIYGSPFSDRKLIVRKALVVFCAAVFLSSLYCVCLGVIRFLHTGDISFLFYHTLVSPINQHAVYFSIYTFICMACLSDLLKTTRSGRMAVLITLLLVWFSGLLFLLRSKMVMCVTLLYACFQLVSIFIQKGNFRRRAVFPACIIFGMLAALLTSNPFSRQLEELRGNNFKVLEVQRFDPGDYFNEVQLRILLWKFSVGILNDAHCWLFGASPGDAQERLNEKIVSHNMYTGVPGTADNGFLDYNVHNQYLETLLRSGLAGLFLLLCILFFAFRNAVRARDIVLCSVLFVFACVFCTESVLERQFGIVPFFFFTCLLMPKSDGQKSPDKEEICRRS